MRDADFVVHVFRAQISMLIVGAIGAIVGSYYVWTSAPMVGGELRPYVLSPRDGDCVELYKYEGESNSVDL